MRKARAATAPRTKARDDWKLPAALVLGMVVGSSVGSLEAAGTSPVDEIEVSLECMVIVGETVNECVGDDEDVVVVILVVDELLSSVAVADLVADSVLELACFCTPVLMGNCALKLGMPSEPMISKAYVSLGSEAGGVHVNEPVDEDVVSVLTVCRSSLGPALSRMVTGLPSLPEYVMVKGLFGCTSN